MLLRRAAASVSLDAGERLRSFSLSEGPAGILPGVLTRLRMSVCAGNAYLTHAEALPITRGTLAIKCVRLYRARHCALFSSPPAPCLYLCRSRTLTGSGAAHGLVQASLPRHLECVPVEKLHPLSSNHRLYSDGYDEGGRVPVPIEWATAFHIVALPTRGWNTSPEAPSAVDCGGAKRRDRRFISVPCLLVLGSRGCGEKSPVHPSLE